MSNVMASNGKNQEQQISSEALLFQSNTIIFPCAMIDSAVAQTIIALILSIAGLNRDPIRMIINSSGGSVTAGLAIIDCMNSVSNEIHTHVMGQAASMGALISTSGEPGHRTVSPYSRIMIHQPLISGVSGQVSDIAILAENLEYTKQVTNSLLAENTGHSIEEIAAITDRDHWYSAEEAVAFSLADSVLAKF